MIAETALLRARLPAIVASLAVTICESLDDASAKTFIDRLCAATQAGADLGRVWPRFALWILEDARHGVIRFTETGSENRAAVDRVAGWYRHLVYGFHVDGLEFLKTRFAAQRATVTGVQFTYDACRAAETAPQFAEQAARYATGIHTTAICSLLADAALDDTTHGRPTLAAAALDLAIDAEATDDFAPLAPGAYTAYEYAPRVEVAEADPDAMAAMDAFTAGKRKAAQAAADKLLELVAAAPVRTQTSILRAIARWLGREVPA